MIDIPTPTESQEALSALPELPEPLGPWHENDDYTGHFTYTADQMRAYAAEATNYYRHLLRAANARGDGDERDAARYRAMRTQAWTQLELEASEFDEEADELVRLYPEDAHQVLTTTPESN